jgi:hypothetical protein
VAIEQKLTASLSKFIGVSASALRGNRDKPEFVKYSGYSMQIQNARNMYILLYDTAAQRGWLVDGASALLHLVRTQVVREPYGGRESLFNDLDVNASLFNHPRTNGGLNAAADALKEERNMKHVILREFDKYTDETTSVPQLESSFTALPDTAERRKGIYTITCIRELVSQTWSTIEQLHDRQFSDATTHTAKQVSNPFKTTLEGYEFMDIVSSMHIYTPRSINLKSNGVAWIDLARQTHAITLFGQHFGDIYKPTASTGKLLCKDWKTVPRCHEFLTVPTSILKDIKERSWKHGDVDLDSTEIVSGLHWAPSKDIFKPCRQHCRHSINRVQKLCSSIQEGQMCMFTSLNGAVILGASSVQTRGNWGSHRHWIYKWMPASLIAGLVQVYNLLLEAIQELSTQAAVIRTYNLRSCQQQVRQSLQFRPFSQMLEPQFPTTLGLRLYPLKRTSPESVLA